VSSSRRVVVLPRRRRRDRRLSCDRDSAIQWEPRQTPWVYFVRPSLHDISSMTTTRPAWYWCVLGTVAMSLGWGLRGSIGGGSLGAMIPGAMIGLVLCLLLNRHSDAGLIAAFAAIGVGFGGQETYGQTVGLSLQPETFWWAILGFVIAGGVVSSSRRVVVLPRRRRRDRWLSVE